MSKIEFISYDGKYPTLCYGILVIKVDNKEYSLSNCMSSGGGCTHDENWEFDVQTGSWSIHEDRLPEQIKKYRSEIEKVVNANVRYGCCGGCI